MECTHCYHDTGNMLLSDPPLIEKICCWCGCKIRVRQLKWTLEGEHGTYRPESGLTLIAADAPPLGVEQSKSIEAAERG